MKNLITFLLIVTFGSLNCISTKTYPFHGKTEDLKPGEYWYVTNDHGTGARDFVITRYDIEGGKWTTVKDNSSNPQTLSDRLVYGIPIYAIADGEVMTCWCNAPENPIDKPHRGRDGCDGSCDDYPNCSCTIPRSGNHLNILNSDGGVILYAHLQPGSIPNNLCPNKQQFVNNANDKSGPEGQNPDVYIPKGNRPKVKKGQFIGLAGHSGASSGPHLHNHLANTKCDGCATIPIRYKDIKVQKRGSGNIDPFAWRYFDGDTLSEGDLILPFEVGNKCIQSKASPDMAGNCIKVDGGNVCVNRLGGNANPNVATSYRKGVDFFTSSVKLELQWCPNANCNSNSEVNGGGIDVIIDTFTGGGGAIVFSVDCNNPTLVQVISDVERITIQQPASNSQCDGKSFEYSFGRWQICEYQKPPITNFKKGNN